MEKKNWHHSISSRAALRDGWHIPPRCLQGGWFWCAESEQRHTDQTRWRQRLYTVHRLSLTPAAPLLKPRLRTGSETSCSQAAAWQASGLSWHSSPEICTGRKYRKQLYNILYNAIFVKLWQIFRQKQNRVVHILFYFIPFTRLHMFIN